MSLALCSKPYITSAQATKLRKLAKAYAQAQVEESWAGGYAATHKRAQIKRAAERTEHRLFQFITSLKGI